MKRAAVGVLILSLALPAFAANAHKMSLTAMRCVSLEHIPGAWRMQIACSDGQGSIVLDDSQKYRGAGLFAGWSQDEMRSVYQSLIPKDESRFEVPQLG